MKVLNKLFNGTDNQSSEPVPGTVYAVTGGRYLGEFFIFIEKVNGTYEFVTLPKLEPRSVSHDKFVIGIDNKILDRIENLPDKIFEMCLAQYRKNKNRS